MGKKIFLMRGDTPPESLERVERVVIHQPSRDPNRMFTGGEYSHTVEFTRYGNKWLAKHSSSADFFLCPYTGTFINGCPWCSDWVSGMTWQDSGCRYDLYPEDLERLLYTSKEVLGEIRHALAERDFDMQVTLFYGNGED